MPVASIRISGLKCYSHTDQLSLYNSCNRIICSETRICPLLMIELGRLAHVVTDLYPVCVLVYVCFLPLFDIKLALGTL